MPWKPHAPKSRLVKCGHLSFASVRQTSENVTKLLHLLGHPLLGWCLFFLWILWLNDLGEIICLSCSQRCCGCYGWFSCSSVEKRVVSVSLDILFYLEDIFLAFLYLLQVFKILTQYLLYLFLWLRGNSIRILNLTQLFDLLSLSLHLCLNLLTGIILFRLGHLWLRRHQYTVRLAVLPLCQQGHLWTYLSCRWRFLHLGFGGCVSSQKL